MNGDPKKEERNIVAINNQTCNPTCEEYIRIDLLGPMPRTIFLNLIQSVSLSIQSVSLSLWIESTLFVIQLILTQFFQSTLYKLIVLRFLGLNPSILGWVTNLVITSHINVRIIILPTTSPTFFPPFPFHLPTTLYINIVFPLSLHLPLFFSFLIHTFLL